MIMRKASLSLLLAILCVPAMATRVAAQTADDIVEKHLAALGGREALGKLTSRRATCTITVNIQGTDVSGTCELTYKAPNKSRAYITLDLSPIGVPDKMINDQKFDGVNGWTLNSLQGDSQITGNQLENMRNNQFPSALLRYKETGATLVVLPGEQVNGKAMLVLLLTPKVGSAVKMYLDAETYLLARTVTKVNMPQQGGDIEQVGDLSDYRTVDGVKVPFLVMNSNPIQSGTIRISKIEHNIVIDDAIFSAKAPAPGK